MIRKVRYLDLYLEPVQRSLVESFLRSSLPMHKGESFALCPENLIKRMVKLVLGTDAARRLKKCLCEMM